MTGRSGSTAPERRQEVTDRERERVGEEDQRAGRGSSTSSSRPANTQPSSEVVGSDVHRSGRPGEPAGPQGHAGPVLHAAAAGQHARRRWPPMNAARVEERLHRRGHVVQRADVVAGDEEDGDVGPGAASARPPPDDLADRRRPRTGCSERAAAKGTSAGRGVEEGSAGGRSVNGTRCHGPRSIRQWATTVPYSSNSSSPRTSRYVNRPGSTVNGFTLRATSSSSSPGPSPEHHLEHPVAGLVRATRDEGQQVGFEGDRQRATAPPWRRTRR